MHSNPEFTHHYRKDQTKEQNDMEDRIVQSTYKILAEHIDLQKEIDSAHARSKMLCWCIVAVTVIIILLATWWSVAHAETINMDAIAQIESSNNPMAYNNRTQATGVYQITPVCLADFRQNCKWKLNKYQFSTFTMENMFNPYMNWCVSKWYLTERIPEMLVVYHKPVTIKNIIWAYNAGIGNVVKGIMPEETKQYLKKYAKLTGGR
jgi:hypothetical protein